MVQENKLNLTKKLLDEAKKQTEVQTKVLKDKEDDVSKSKEQLRWAKEDTIKEYCNSDTLLYELGCSFADGFDSCLHQLKASFPDLDLSHISIDAPEHTLAHPVD